MTKQIISRESFSEYIISPLKNVFGGEVYWNGKDVLNKNLKLLKNNQQGACYFTENSSFIILKYKPTKPLSMLSTLMHEYAHMLLHSYRNPNDDKLKHCIEEFEAEMISKSVLNAFGVQSKELDKSLNGYLKQCDNNDILHRKCLGRDSLLSQLCIKIINALKDSKEFIDKIHEIENSNLGYQVKCPLCLNEWHFSEKSIYIKELYNYHCPYCGEDKTSGRLIIYKVQKNKSI